MFSILLRPNLEDISRALVSRLPRTATGFVMAWWEMVNLLHALSGCGRGLPMQNAEIFKLTYGSIIRQLITKCEDVEEVNKQLEQMGFHISVQLVDEYLARKRVARCTSFKDSMEAVTKQAFPMFLSMPVNVTNWSSDAKECSLVFTDNPSTEFVELPEELRDLKYCNLLCGVLRGALEQVNMDVEVNIVGDMLTGDATHELRAKLREHRTEKYPFKDDD